MPKHSKAYIAKRRKHIAQEILKNPNISVNELISNVGKVLNIKSGITVKNEVEICKDILALILSMGIYQLWKDTPFEDKLLKEAESKKRLANQLVNFIGENKRHINTLLLGTGTTVYEITKEILSREQELAIRKIYTTSLLVLHAFVLKKPKDIELEMVGGDLNDQTASLISQNGVSYLRKQPVDAVITSFWGLSEEGFSTAQDFEVDEKLMNLRPNMKCNYIMIPMAWSKIGSTGRLIVKSQKKGEKPEDVLDFPEVKSERQKHYIIFTDYPEGILKEKDVDRSKILKCWVQRGVEVKNVRMTN
jgi:DeoR/GlpR family transcriptional regulator of sugar metabolism